jgi:membrane-associated phospholipid phosphatase
MRLDREPRPQRASRAWNLSEVLAPPWAPVVIAVALVVTAWARLAERAHPLSEVVGGITTGLAVALGMALALSAWTRGGSR